MQDTLETELLQIVAAIALPMMGAVTLAGRPALHVGVAGPVPSIAASNPSVAQLQQLIYDWCYCRRFDRAAPAPISPPAADLGFVEPLSAANASRERWDMGWQILQTLPSSQIVAAKGAMTRMVWPSEFLAHGPPGM